MLVKQSRRQTPFIPRAFQAKPGSNILLSLRAIHLNHRAKHYHLGAIDNPLQGFWRECKIFTMENIGVYSLRAVAFEPKSKTKKLESHRI